jgi:dCTP deaminase
MIINGDALLKANPIVGMATNKKRVHGLSYGLSEVGYDIRTKQEIIFSPPQFRPMNSMQAFGWTTVDGHTKVGRTALASTVEEFQMPNNLWGEMRNKSTLARQFVDAAIGTDIEPGWAGFLTLELIFNGQEKIIIPAGSPIAKVVFHEIAEPAKYDGKYQNQEDKPVEARFS